MQRSSRLQPAYRIEDPLFPASDASALEPGNRVRPMVEVGSENNFSNEHFIVPERFQVKTHSCVLSDTYLFSLLVGF